MDESGERSLSWVLRLDNSVKCRCIFINCGSWFDSLPELTGHIRKHVQDLQYGGYGDANVCPVEGCGHFLSSTTELQRHLHMHIFHAQREYSGLLAIVKKKDVTHLNSCGYPASSKLVYDGALLNCEWEDCTLFFDDVVSYADHIHDHIDVLCSSDRDQRSLYNCGWKGCTMKFRNKSNLRTHVRHHSGDKTTACPFCGAFFSNNSKLFNHMVRKLGTEEENGSNSGPIVCQFCQKCFESERLLREHVRRHVMSYKCQFCTLMVDCPSALHRHILSVHANLRQYNCEKCDRKFAQKADLERHLTLHSEDLAHACEECGEKFRWRKQLQAHIKKHKEGYKQYTHLCHLCEAKYANGFGLSRHLSKKHKCSIPEGFTRYQYKRCADGFMRLQTKRCLSKTLALQLGITQNDSSYVTV